MLRTIEKTVPTHIRLSVELNNRLNQTAKKLNTTKAELIRHLLKKGVVRL
jgi:predicted DNA-binding protein